MQDEIECGPAKRRILGDKIELPMEPASGNTVLIIEDERDVVDLLALNLRKAGFAISSAPTR